MRALSNITNYNTRNKELNFEDIHVLFFMSHAFIMHCLSLREHDERDESRREREQYRLTEPILLVVIFLYFLIWDCILGHNWAMKIDDACQINILISKEKA